MPTASFRNLTDTAATCYQRYFVPAIARPAADPLLAAADLRPGERVLDVACGTGVIARLAAAEVGPDGAVAAIDLAPDMIEVARREPAPSGTAIDWHVGDAAALPFDDAGYDAVLCQMGLMFMTDRPAALAEMRRTLRPGGRLVVSTPGEIQAPFSVLERALVEHLGADLGVFVRAVFSMPDADAVGSLLDSAGLRDVRVEVPTVHLHLPAPAEFLWQYINLSPLGPLVSAAPEPARREMERQAVAQWQPYVVGGRLVLEQPIVIAGGRR